jgi:NAD(P)-dependent dehydrogenase (short-subunit alcohol dehydrogenase family)
MPGPAGVAGERGPLMELTGKIALVTGASKGIGAAIALGYAEAGAHVALAARDAEKLEAVAGQIQAAGGSCSVHPLDVTEHTAVARTIDAIVEEHGRLDILCNNAGVIDAGHVADVPPERMAAVFAVNVFGLYAGCHAALPHMRDAGYGRIVNMGSGSAYTCTPGEAVYSSSKAAVHVLTVALAREVRESGILVNAMSPGDIRTDMNPHAVTEAVEAVPTALWLASLPDDGPSGRFFRFMEEIPILPDTDVDFSAGPD